MSRNGKIAGLSWVRRKSWPRQRHRSNERLNLVDLFCGCGGMTLGAWEAARLAGRRFNVRLAVDIAATPLAVFTSNFCCGEETAVCSAVERMFNGKLGSCPTAAERVWRRRVGRVDILMAGPPCQGHSDLNNVTRRGDPRNSLYLRVVRAAEVLDPPAVIVENVPTVVLDRGGVVGIACRALRSVGYRVVAGVVPLLRLGVPQNRKRHVLVATKEAGIELSDLSVGCRSEGLTVGPFLSGLEDEPEESSSPFYQPSRMTVENRRRVAYLFKKELYNLPDRLRPPCHRDKDHAYVSMYGRMRWDQPAQTITSGFGSIGQGRFVHPMCQRTLTSHEAARLQGFPDFFDFSSVSGVTALREMIGNAVPPQLTAVLISQLISMGHV